MRFDRTALFLMVGQSAERAVSEHAAVAPAEPLALSPSADLAEMLPELVHEANDSALAYRYFFVFERYLRTLVVDVLSDSGKQDWWPKLPPDVQQDIEKLAGTEEMKSWMALGSRDKSALMTFPQMLRVVEVRWKEDFEDLLGDKALLHEARMIGHLRNTICHMSWIPPEELERVKMTMRDWFRKVAP